MGIFKRLSDILTADVNDLLDRAENPEKMIKQVIREMDEAVQAAKRNVAQALASQKKLEKELQTNKRLRDEWQRKAQQAVEMDRDDLGRQALARKKECENLIVILQQQYESTRQTTESLRQTLKALQAKLADAKRKKMMLIARKKTAEAQIAAQDKLATGTAQSKADSFAKFERFEEQVEDLEAEAQALKEIDEAETAAESEFEESVDQADIEIELEQLKKQVRKGKTEAEQ